MSLEAQIIQRIAASFKSPLDVGEGKYEPNVGKTTNFANGTGDDQANKIFSDIRTLSASASENLDLSGGLTDAFGNSIAFTKIKAIYVYAASGNTNNVNVTRPASNGVPIFLTAGDGVPVQPDGTFQFVAPKSGITVTASTGDILTIANSAGSTSVTYTIVIIGIAS